MYRSIVVMTALVLAASADAGKGRRNQSSSCQGGSCGQVQQGRQVYGHVQPYQTQQGQPAVLSQAAAQAVPVPSSAATRAATAEQPGDPDGFSLASGNPVVIGHGAVGEWMPDGTVAAFTGGVASLTKVQPANSAWKKVDGKWTPIKIGNTTSSYGGDRSHVPAPTPVSSSGADDALDEVNAQRARMGQRPFVKDVLLTQGARACALFRAARGIEGHTHNDFSFLPAGGIASVGGAGAWPVGLVTTNGETFGACGTDGNYTYAGAAWAMGSNGKRFMQLFAR